MGRASSDHALCIEKNGLKLEYIYRLIGSNKWPSQLEGGRLKEQEDKKDWVVM